MVAATGTATMSSWLLHSDRKRSKATSKEKDQSNQNTNSKASTKSFFSNLYSNHNNEESNHKSKTLGILAFDAAKTITNLISLYRSLSDAEITRLRRSIIASRGVAYLNSDDEGFLLALACAERLEDLDRAANSVSRLGSRCSDSSFLRFDLVYRDLKLGYVDIDKILNHGTKEIERSIEKLDKCIVNTSNLYAELEALSQLEASERRLNEWKQNKAVAAAVGAAAEAAHIASVEAFELKIAGQRKLVRQLKEASMWGQSFDKTVNFSARVISFVFARLCAHFGPYVSVLPLVKSTSRSKNGKVDKQNCHVVVNDRALDDVLDKLFDDPELIKESHSGPIMGTGLCSFGFSSNSKATLVRFMSQDANVLDSDNSGGFSRYFSSRPKNKVFQAASPSTVGGSGLATRYADIIILAERYIKSEYMVGDQARKELYEMLPGGLRAHVRSKLRKSWRHVEEDEARMSGAGEALAVGWRDAVQEILQWLGPIAHDTLTWQNERSIETQSFDVHPTVLLLQTLHFSDLVKTEAAVAEVLVGLSCICRYENRQLTNGDGDGDMDDS